MARFWVVFFLCASAAGCTASDQDKLGADGERCLADVDCREGLECRSGLCAQPGGARNNGVNNGANNGPSNNGLPNSGPANNGFPNNGPGNNVFPNNGDPNNGPPNNGIPPDPDPDPVEPDSVRLCREFCDHLDECNIDFGPTCVDECLGVVDDGQREVIRCLIAADCDEVVGDACFSQPPDQFCGDGVCDPGEQRRCPQDCRDDLAACYDVCAFISSCDELVNLCGQEVTDEIHGACDGLCLEPDARVQILAAQGLSCDDIVPLVINGFDLQDVCR